MKKNEPISSIMANDLITTNSSEKFSEVKKKMESKLIHHMPVVDGKKLIGMISRVDILNFTNSQAFVKDNDESAKMLDNSVTVSDIMTTKLITIKNTDTIKHAVEILNNHSFNSIPVVTEQHELVGIVTSKDLINHMYKQY